MSNVELSDDELRAIADEARAWEAVPGCTSEERRLGEDEELTLMSHGYACGVVAERKRSRNLQQLAVQLALHVQSFATVYKTEVKAVHDALRQARTAGLLPNE